MGSFNPEISAGFTAVPSRLYWPIVPLFGPPEILRFATYRLDPDMAIPAGPLDPSPEISGVYQRAVEVVLANRAAAKIRDVQA